jgi:hypothetical protein
MMRPVIAGSLRGRLELYDVPETAKDSYGQRARAGTLLGTFRGEVRPLSGRELLNVRAIWPTATHRVTLRWLGSSLPTSASNPRGLILPRMYVVDLRDGNRLDVVFASNVEHLSRKWELTCESKVNT